MGFQPAVFAALRACQTSLQILGGRKAKQSANLNANK